MFEALWLLLAEGRHAYWAEGRVWQMAAIPTGCPVYRARVVRQAPALGGAFVDLGGSTALLHTRRRYLDGATPVVQVAEPAQGTKQAVVEDRVGYEGQYLVYLPNEAEVRYSHNLSAATRAALGALRLPPCGWIVRSAAEGAPLAAIEAEAQALLAAWRRLPTHVGYLYTPPTDWGALVGRAQNVLCDDADWCAAHPQWGVAYRADLAAALPPMEDATARIVTTPEGVQLVFDRTEAALVVDVNSAGYMPPMEAQAAAMAVNRIAAKELVRRLLLREVTGVVLVDFVSMPAVAMVGLLDYLADLATRYDPRLRIVDRTKLGWVELTRSVR